MIFAELEYDCHYSDIHDRLVSLLQAQFTAVESGHQGDSWVWIHDRHGRVAIDTFTSMRHQVKAEFPGSHVQRVITALQQHFCLIIKDPPELE